MKKIFCFYLFLAPLFTFAQPLSIDSTNTGYSPSYCRLFYYQNGGGIVYGAVMGGTPPYTYLWTSLADSQTSSNSTWAGLNPGYYELKVWDDVNDSVSYTLFLDSLNPIAAFDVVSSGLSQVGPSYVGNAPVSVDYVNQSTNSANPNSPSSDPFYFWKLTQFQSPYLEQTNATQSYTYNYGGDWYVQLEVQNENGCSDVLTKHLNLTGPALIEQSILNEPKVYYDLKNREITVLLGENSLIDDMSIFDYSGRFIANYNLNQGMNKLKVKTDKAGLLYSLKTQNGNILFKGKTALIQD